MIDPKTIEKIKISLLERKVQLEKELSSFAQKNKHIPDDYKAKFPEYGDKDDENVAEIAEYGDKLSLEKSLEKTLRDINKTLERIDKGEYGICKYCGKEINEKRLLARPVSSACMVCKKKLANN